MVLVGSKRSFQTGGAKAPPGQPALLHFLNSNGKNSLPKLKLLYVIAKGGGRVVENARYRYYADKLTC